MLGCARLINQKLRLDARTGTCSFKVQTLRVGHGAKSLDCTPSAPSATQPLKPCLRTTRPALEKESPWPLPCTFWFNGCGGLARTLHFLTPAPLL